MSLPPRARIQVACFAEGFALALGLEVCLQALGYILRCCGNHWACMLQGLERAARCMHLFVLGPDFNA